MPVPEVSFNKQDESCLNANDGKATINISGGVPPYIIKWNNDCEGIFQSNLAPGNYYVIVTDSNNCQENISFYIEPSYEYCSNPHIVIPNIFSPNNDGKNDILYVRGYGIESIHFMIYDRWGNKVFESYSITEGWNANNYQVGTYVYYVEATLINGKTIKENGTITLIR